MIFDPGTAQHLKPWLVRTLEPICDAEPGALADYILALLKHNVPESEMRKELAVQLDEFLEKECSSFIDTLFTVLRTKSYLPYAPASPTAPSFDSKSLDTGIPIPLDGLLSPSISTSLDRGRKRNNDNDDRDGRPPAKGPRLSTEGQFSRYSNGNGGRPEARSTGNWGGRPDRSTNGYRDSMEGYGAGMGMMGGMGGMGMSGMNGSMGQMNGRRQQVYQPPDQKRGICRDYHNNGYCARGAMCKYSHGDDAVIPGNLYPMNGAGMPVPGMPFMPMFPGGPGVPFGPGAAYDPHEARMDMRPMGGRFQHRAPLLPRIQQEDGTQVVQTVRASGELPVIQDLTPALPPDTPKPQSDSQVQPPSQQSQPPLPQPPQQASIDSSTGFEQNRYGGMQQGGMNGQSYVSTNIPMDVDMAPAMDMGPGKDSHGGSFRSGMRSGGGRGRGTFGGEAHTFRPERRNDKTLVVEKIPEDKLTLEQVNEWFKRFGTVTNVAIDSVNAKALVSFSTHEEAHAAWKSEDAVFNNRFVKVFWHRPMEGHGQIGAKMLAASAPLIANIVNKDSSTRPAAVPSIPSTSTPTPRRKMTAASATASALAAKQQLLEQQIAEQKSLMASLTTASADEKKEIMARLRKPGEEMKTIPVTTPAPPTLTPTKKPVGASLESEDHQRKERERLDKELEIHHATAAVEGKEDSTEDLKTKLERLKAEAVSLGITEDPSAAASYGGTFRPYRGRGRGGRSYYRGGMRGGPPRASMKLDNRPKKLLIKSVSGEGVQALRDWFETTGQVESLATVDSGDIIVTFKSRAAAEQGLAKGHDVPTIGPVQMTWYTDKQSTTPVPKAAIPGTASSGPADSEMHDTARRHSPQPVALSPRRIQEEEVVSGWGEDPDGDGMGML